MPEAKDVRFLLDSGAVSIYDKFCNTKLHPQARGFANWRDEDHSYAESDEFRAYQKSYIKFTKENDNHISAYVNLDIIHNAEESYNSLKCIESQGGHPLPVFHIGNDEKWLKKYLDEGYTYICIGGIRPNPWKSVKPVLDHLWSTVMTDSKGYPRVKYHGLAATSFQLMLRYSWFSVDSTSWLKMGVYGGIYVPQYGGNKQFQLNKPPRIEKISSGHSLKEENRRKEKKKKKTRNDLLPKSKNLSAEHLSKATRLWLERIGVPVGLVDKHGEMVEWGVVSNWEARSLANMLYFQQFVNSLPPYPWPFRIKEKKGLLG